MNKTSLNKNQITY